MDEDDVPLASPAVEATRERDVEKPPSYMGRVFNVNLPPRRAAPAQGQA
jgi:hypothetical protein